MDRPYTHSSHCPLWPFLDDDTCQAAQKVGCTENAKQTKQWMISGKMWNPATIFCGLTLGKSCIVMRFYIIVDHWNILKQMDPTRNLPFSCAQCPGLSADVSCGLSNDHILHMVLRFVIPELKPPIPLVNHGEWWGNMHPKWCTKWLELDVETVLNTHLIRVERWPWRPMSC